jgi:catechol 2,3-dioxygenase-like lactoylglutathione lyase family enzyme
VSGEAALVPELSVSDWQKSRDFYRELLGFDVSYERPEEGFAYLRLGSAAVMIDQIGVGRDFAATDAAPDYPFGRGLNLQIRVPSVPAILDRLRLAGIALIVEPEDKWYRRNDDEVGNRQFVVADPDGYLLRLYEDLGERPLTPPTA